MSIDLRRSVLSRLGRSPKHSPIHNLSYQLRPRIKLLPMFVTHFSASLQLSMLSLERWRWVFFTLSLAVVLLTIGLTALGVFLVRRRTSNLALLYFSIFVILYAARMIVRDGALIA